MKLQARFAGARGGTGSNVIFAVLALGLCGLCTLQFQREGKFQLLVEGLSRTNAVVTGELAESRKEAGRWKDEVTEVTTRLGELEKVVQSNRVEIAGLQTRLRGASNNMVVLTRSREAFQQRFEEQAEVTRRATEQTRKLKADAEAEIQKIQALAEERTATANKYAHDYQELVAAFEKFRTQVRPTPAQ